MKNQETYTRHEVIDMMNSLCEFYIAKEEYVRLYSSNHHELRLPEGVRFYRPGQIKSSLKTVHSAYDRFTKRVPSKILNKLVLAR